MVSQAVNSTGLALSFDSKSQFLLLSQVGKMNMEPSVLSEGTHPAQPCQAGQGLAEE